MIDVQTQKDGRSVSELADCGTVCAAGIDCDAVCDYVTVCDCVTVCDLLCVPVALWDCV